MKIAKHHLRLLAAIVATTGFTMSAHAQQTPLTESQTAAILKQLEDLQNTLNGSKSSNNSKALSVFTQGATSGKLALDLYLNCVKAYNFEREEKRESEFRDWKNRSEDLHKSDEFQLVLRMQLLYLVATIKTSEAEKIDDALPSIENFLTFYLQLDKLLHYPEDYKRGAGRLRDIAGSDILQTAFAKQYKLNATVIPAAGWPASPTDICALFDGFLLPAYREAKNATALAATWDKRIAHQKNLALAHREEESIGRLNAIGEEILPRLEWGKAKDLFEYGNQATGAAAMIAVVKANLSHPDATAWLEEIISLVKNEPEEEIDGPDTEAAGIDDKDKTPTIRDLLLDGES